MKLEHIIMIAILSSGCALTNVENYRGGRINESYPKTSSDASILYQLQSNKPNTHFFIDGKEIGVGRHLKVYINDRAHNITAQPDGCIEKEEYIQPPYNSLAPLGFTYLLGECGDSKISSTTEKTPNNPQPITININNSPEIKIANKQNNYQKTQTKIQNNVNNPSFPGTGRYYALIIDRNEHHEISKSSSEAEAKEVANLLESIYGFNVKLLLNAKIQDIGKTITEFKSKISRDDSFVIYYAHIKDKTCKPRITSFSHVKSNQFLANTGC